MTRYKVLISACLVWMMAIEIAAQTSTNSPYTRYGFGQLSDQSFGNSQAMGGISYGLRNGLQVNASNPDALKEYADVLYDQALLIEGLPIEDPVAYAKKIATENNCYKMMLLTGSKRPETLNFYAGAGYNSTDKTAFVQWL